MNILKANKLGLLALAVVSIALITLINTSLSRARVDLTADKVYTVSEGARNFLTSLEQNVSLKLYFSDENTRDIIPLRNYRQRVVELIEEYVLLADGKINFEQIDPQPFSIQEDEANAAGINAVAINEGRPDVFFGLSSSSDSGQKSIAFMHPQRERLLEYDINDLIYQSLSPEKPKIGLLSSLSLSGGYGQGGPTDPWVSYEQLQLSFTVQQLDNAIEEIPEDLDALLLVHPADVSLKTLYAIDQYALGGGKLVAFLDPYAEQANPLISGAFPAPEDSTGNLSELLAAWGVSVGSEVVADISSAMSVNFNGRNQRHPVLVNYEGRSLDSQDPISANLNRLLLSSPGHIQAEAQSGLEFTPLLSTSENTGVIASSVYSVSDLEANFQNIQPRGQQLALAGRISGEANSAYPQGVEIEVEVEISDSNASADSPADSLADTNASAEPETRTETFQYDEPLASGSINVLLVADSDILSDRLWVSRQNFFGQTLLNPFTDNNDLLQNAVASYTGSDDLISIRGRQPYARYFDTVEDLRRDAEQRLRQKQEELQLRLQATEDKINELQQQKDGNETLALTSEQQAAIAQFSKERIEIRKQLRAVRHQLDRDIEQLGMQVKLVNIALVPLLIIVFALLRNYWLKVRRPSSS